MGAPTREIPHRAAHLEYYYYTIYPTFDLESSILYEVFFHYLLIHQQKFLYPSPSTFVPVCQWLFLGITDHQIIRKRRTFTNRNRKLLFNVERHKAEPRPSSSSAAEAENHLSPSIHPSIHHTSHSLVFTSISVNLPVHLITIKLNLNSLRK